jgi:para-nitrobenzyl esterase
MVWIYGGGFIAGSTSIPLYSGEQLAKHGVVVVSIAYRLGPMGFLAHPELSAESPQHTSGNYGLLDQIAGLQWVQRNIAAFGGDPRKVTVFGESAGGISVSLLAGAPLAKGLFRGVISESGGSFGPTRRPGEPGENMPTLADAERAGIAYTRRLGAGSIAELRKLSAQSVQNAGFELGTFWPVLDGKVIVGDQYEAYRKGGYNDTPILIGTNSDEGALFGPPASTDAYVAAVHARFGPYAAELLKLYPPTPSQWRQSSMDLARDVAFAWHTWVWADLQSQTGKSKAFVYYFDHVPPRAPDSPFNGAIGAVHTEEMPYVFQHLDLWPVAWTPQDRALSETLASYWTNFAKYGDPNAPGLPPWPAFEHGNQAVMRFERRPQAGPVPNLRKLQGLDAYFAWRRTPAGAAMAATGRQQ